MENTIFRKKGSNNSEIEFYTFSTNEIEPYREIKELGIVVLHGEKQFDFDLNENDIDELIKYLQDIKEHVSQFNFNSRNIKG